MASSVIRDFSYDTARNELTVTFAGGSRYVYALVPPAVFSAFSEAESKGAFHNAHIRDRYPYRKVAADRPQAATSLRDALRASRDDD